MGVCACTHTSDEIYMTPYLFFCPPLDKAARNCSGEFTRQQAQHLESGGRVRLPGAGTAHVPSLSDATTTVHGPAACGFFSCVDHSFLCKILQRRYSSTKA